MYISDIIVFFVKYIFCFGFSTKVRVFLFLEFEEYFK